MPNSFDTITTMRNIIRQLRQTEIQNANLAGNWANEEIKQAAALNNNIGNVPEMAGKADRLAGILQQIYNSANGASQQLDNLERLLNELDNG
jgi:hypothetical protein